MGTATRFTATPADASSGRPRWATLGAGVLFALAVTFTVSANYVSSWFPLVGGFPAGAVFRDLFCGALVLAGGASFVASRPTGVRAFSGPASRILAPGALFVIWTFGLVAVASSRTIGVLAARNLVFFPLVAIATVALLDRRLLSRRAVIWVLVVAGCVTAGLGILDTFSSGAIVDDLGFRRDYSGVAGADTRLIAGMRGAFNGVVRASGGVSNALVFGYLMSLLAVTATWFVVTNRRLARHHGLLVRALAVLASLATVLSLTRGAYVALLVGLLVVIAFNFRRDTLITVGLVLASTIAISALVSTALASTGPTSTAPTSAVTSGLAGAIADRSLSSDAASQGSSIARLDQLRSGATRLASDPLGTGLGSEGSAADRAGIIDKAVAPDVYALIVGLQTGVPGLVLWVAVLASIAWWALRKIRTPAASIVLAALAIYGVASVLSSSPDAPVFSLAVWLVLLGVPALIPARPEPGPGPIGATEPLPADASRGAAPRQPA